MKEKNHLRCHRQPQYQECKQHSHAAMQHLVAETKTTLPWLINFNLLPIDPSKIAMHLPHTHLTFLMQPVELNKLYYWFSNIYFVFFHLLKSCCSARSNNSFCHVPRGQVHMQGMFHPTWDNGHLSLGQKLHHQDELSFLPQSARSVSCCNLPLIAACLDVRPADFRPP